MNTSITKRALPSDRYWASADVGALADTIMEKARAFRARLDEEGRLDVWRASERTYYGLDGQGGWKNSVAVTFAGEQGELVVARFNHYRSIAQAIIAMVTGARPAFKSRAVNTDVKSLSATKLADGVVDWVYRSKRIETLRVEQVESAVISGEGYMHLRWDVHRGRAAEQRERPVYDAQGVAVMDDVREEVPDELSGGTRVVSSRRPRMESYDVREGDVVPEVLHPLEVVRDLDTSDMRWCIVPHRENVWDLAARYPAQRAQILAQRGQPRWPRAVWVEHELEKPRDDDDAVTVWCFYHLPCDALPKGRYSLVCGSVVLVDQEWRFDPDEIPVYDLVPMRQRGTGSGHSAMWDLLCLQELYDACMTALASATEGRGQGTVIAPKGSDIQPEMLSRAFQLLEYEVVPEADGKGKPESLPDLFSVNADTYQIEEILKRLMETLSGINSTVRGDPDAQLKSGRALAIVSSLSTHFNSSTQGGVTRNDERIGTGLLKLYQRWSPIPRLAEITGTNGTTQLKEFTSEELRSVQRVTVEITNPALRQGVGLLDLADRMLEKGVIKSVAEYVEMVESGKIDPLLDPIRDPLRQIMRENEELAAGKPCPVSEYDNDQEHMRHHRRVIDDPEKRKDPSVVAALEKHMADHGDRLFSKPVTLMYAIGQEVPPWRTGEAAALGAAAPPSGMQAPDGAPQNSAPPDEPAPPMGEQEMPMNMGGMSDGR